MKSRKVFWAEMDRAWIEINLNHLSHNVKVLRAAMPPECELMAVVKADAYGHGAFEIAPHLNRMGVRAFAAATIDEGIALRKAGISGEILILGYTAPARAGELRRYDLTQTLIDHAYALALVEQGCKIKVHIKVDTGMHRLGFDWEDTENVLCVFAMRQIKVCGIYTHLCVSDSIAEADRRFTTMQIERFYALLARLKEKGVVIPKVHIQSSYGLLHYPGLQCDYVRVGIALYGVLSSPGDIIGLRSGQEMQGAQKAWNAQEQRLDLKPVLSLKARVVLVREIRKGESGGYGRDFVAERDSRIAILSIGYADGYPRNLSCGNGYVLIGGRKAKVAGKICMDQMAVDVTDIPGVRPGMTATLIGRDGKEEIKAEMIAEQAESITNELFSRLGGRLER